jgi:hypothetical protein
LREEGFVRIAVENDGTREGEGKKMYQNIEGDFM